MNSCPSRLRNIYSSMLRLVKTIELTFIDHHFCAAIVSDFKHIILLNPLDQPI